MSKWKLVPCEANEEMTAAGRKAWDNNLNADEFLARAYQLMLNAAPAPDVQPVAWQYKKEGGGIFASDQCPADIEVWNDIEWFNPLYPHPPAADVAELVALLSKAEDLLAGYIETLSNQGAMLSYGNSLLSEMKAALAKWEGK